MSMLSAFGGGKGHRSSYEKCVKSITEHKVVQNLRAVSGYESLFAQWYQKFTTALG